MTTKKKPATKSTKVSKKPAKATEFRSFKRSPERSPFLSFRLTHQTAYWLILSIFILGIGIWFVTLGVKAIVAYDNVDSSQQSDRKN